VSRGLRLKQFLFKHGAVFGIFNCHFQGVFHRCDATDAEQDTLIWQVIHKLEKPLPFNTTEQVLCGDAHIIKEQLARILALLANFTYDFPT